jgi:hypothetical protein
MASRSTIAVLAALSVAASGAAAALHGAMMPITIACAALAEGLAAWLSASALQKKISSSLLPQGIREVRRERDSIALLTSCLRFHHDLHRGRHM